MCRLTPEVLTEAISAVDQMDLLQKESLADEIYKQQPNLLASVLVHSRMGSPMERIDRVLHVLLVAVQATKIAGVNLRLITEDDQERNLGRYVGHVKFLEGLDSPEVQLWNSTSQIIPKSTCWPTPTTNFLMPVSTA